MMGEESMDEPSVENNSSQASTVEEKKPTKAVEAPKQEIVYENQ
ncbi:hypothetical protein JTS93_11015 [Clostridium botulinum]|nr:hypothetical protein [Clostridium botulinum]